MPMVCRCMNTLGQINQCECDVCRREAKRSEEEKNRKKEPSRTLQGGRFTRHQATGRRERLRGNVAEGTRAKRVPDNDWFRGKGAQARVVCEPDLRFSHSSPHYPHALRHGRPRA